MLRLKFYIKRLNFFQQSVKIFSKKFCQETFPNFPRISEKIPTGKFSGKFFRKNVGNFFDRRPVRKPSKSPPGLFRKTGGLFVRIRFVNVCFLHKFRRKPGWFPYGSRQFPGKSPGEFPREFPEIPGGKPGVFFRFFLCFTDATQG